MKKIKTVLGDISESDIGITLPHEHICCYSECLYQMMGDHYIAKKEILNTSVNYLKKLNKKYRLQTFIDCTPVNIGRDIEMLKKVSEQSGVNIICSTGFYYTEEPIIYNMPVELLSEYITLDAVNVNAGIIKCAVESESISPFTEKLLRASAKAQLKIGLPIVIHTNARNRNGIEALEILLSEGVKPCAITVSHLSDTEDIEYVKHFAKCGCYIGLDRLYCDTRYEYVQRKIKMILALCESGYDNKILLSHDAQFFNGFEENYKIDMTPRFNYCFDYILPQLQNDISGRILNSNVIKMLKCEE